MNFISFLLFFLLSIRADCMDMPDVPFEKRHIIFQAGRIGDKPWDPNASSTVTYNFGGAVFTKPIYVDSSYNVSPGVFKDWKWDFKSKSFTLTIDESLKFDRDRKINAKDVEFAFLKSFLSDFGFYSRASLEDIIGIKSLIGKKKFFSGMCKGIKILNDSQ
ncbi:MAG: hypothetical protein AAF203_04520, partial [Pseudomonadota bacterium]